MPHHKAMAQLDKTQDSEGFTTAGCLLQNPGAFLKHWDLCCLFVLEFLRQSPHYVALSGQDLTM